MTTRSKSRALCVAASLAIMTLAPASAFAMPATANAAVQDGGSGERSQGRVQRRARSQPAAQAAVTPEQALADAQAFLTANSNPCQVTEASMKGKTADGSSLYEVVCANDFGLMVLTSAQPMILSCLEISETQKRALAADPAAQLGPKCELPANDNYLAVLTAFASQAGVPCTVSEANIIGKRAGTDVYEIGCAGADGYQIAKENGSWNKTSCLELASANSTCNFTTKDEQIATVTSWFTGSPAAGCNITDVRYMGGNANGAFYEAACNGADGLIARLDAAKAVQQVYPCAEAAQIGGGCKLTAGAPQGTNG